MDVAEAPPPEEVAIRVRGLVTRFGSVTIHRGLDLDVRRGEILGVIGPSGEGKSVLLRAIVGLKEPAEGDVWVLGRRAYEGMPREERRFLERSWGVMFQDGALFSNLTVRENVMAPMREQLRGLSMHAMADLADLKIRMAGLPQAAALKRPSELSGGMRKRAALARALAMDPDLLFLDEPTAGLDPISAARFDTLVVNLRDALGFTVFLVTHDLDTLRATCDRIAVLKDGKVAAIGPLDEIQANAQGWVADYFNGPRARAAFTREQQD